MKNEIKEYIVPIIVVVIAIIILLVNTINGLTAFK